RIEADRVMGAGQRLRYDRAHFLFDAIDLVLADRAEIASGDGGRGDDVRLARRLEADLVGVEIRRLPAADQPDIVGQLVLGKLAAELVDDPRKLIDRPIVAGADARRVGAAAGDRQRPVAGTPASGRSHVHWAVGSVFDRQVLEIERDVG